jgi:endoglucanase
MKSIRNQAAWLSLVGLCASACIAPQEKTQSDAKQVEESLKSCDASGLIDDGEDNDNQTANVGNRGGYWYTFVDKAGSTVSPTAGDQGGTFTMQAGGANGSRYAANVKGQLAKGETVYAAMAFNFVDPKGTYDASRYAGITFFGKRGQGSSARLRVKVPDAQTDPAGGTCSECFNDFGFDLELGTEWTRYVLPFSKMRQMEGWGAPRPSHIDPSKIYGVQFQVNEKGAAYDVSVDDVAFICR